MNDNDKAVLAEAEQILNDAVAKRSEAQSAEHIRAMPHLYKMAKQLIAQSPKPDGKVHLLVIREAGEVNPDELSNPLNLDTNAEDNTAAEFSLAHSWDTTQEAIGHLTNPIASILYNEARKQSGGQSLFVVTSNNLCANYTAHKLTVSRAVMGDEMMTWHTSITKDDDPKGFFAKCQATSDEAHLVAGLIALGEQARMMEQDQPRVYQVMLKRVRETLNNIADDDDSEG